MFSPEIAKKTSYVLNTEVERELIALFDDLISQETKKIKANSNDLELRIAAVKLELLGNLKNYRQLLGTSIKNYGNNG